MKRIVNIIILLCVGLAAGAQWVPSSSYGNSYNRGSFKFTFFMPTLNAKPTTLNSTDLHMFALFGDSVTGKLYKYNPKTLLFTDVLDSAFIRADWNEALRQLTLTRANGSTFATVISGGGSGGGGGATDFTLTRVDSTLTETWNTGPTHSININDIRIKQADINKWNAAVQTGDLAAYLKKTDSTNIYAAKYYVDTGKNAMRVLIASKIGIGTTAGGDLSGTYPNPSVAFFNGQAPAYYLNYNNLTNKLTAGNWITLNSNQIAVSPGGTAAEVLRGDGTKSAEADPVYSTDKPNVMLLKMQSLGGASNLNTYTETGLYHQASDVNAGTGTNYPVARAGMLETQSNGQGTFIYQKYHTYGSFNAVYYRSYNSTWSAWVKVPQATDYNTQDLASVLNNGNIAAKDIILGDYASATGAGFYSRRLQNGKGIGAYMLSGVSGSNSGAFFGFTDNVTANNSKVIGLMDNIGYPVFAQTGDAGVYEIFTSKARPFPLYQYGDHIGSDVNQSIDTLKGNTVTYAYNTGTYNSGSPYNGTVATFGSKSGNYQLQLSSNYISSQLSFRTKNSDLNTWNGWRTVQSVEGLNLQSVLDGGNSALSTMQLGSQANTNGYQLTIARNYLGYGYTGQFAITGTDATNSGLNLIATGQGLPAKTQYLILAPGTNAPLYSPDNNATKYNMLHTGNSTLQLATTNGGLTDRSIIITGSTSFTTDFTGLQMYWDGSKSIVRSINRTANFPTPLQLSGGNGTDGNTNTIQISSNLTYNTSVGNDKQIWFQDGPNTTTSSVGRFTGINNIATSGIGTEIFYQNINNYGAIQAINRTGNFFMPMRMQGANNSTSANVLLIDSTIKYNGAQIWYNGGVNSTGSVLQVTGGASTTTLTGVGAEIQVGGGIPLFYGYDRTNKYYVPTQLRGANNSNTPNTLQVGTDLTYNSNQVWYSGSTMSTSTPITSTNTITGANLTTAGTVSTAFVKTTGSKPTVAMSSGATGTATLNSTANSTAGTITVTLTNTVPINANLVQLSFANSLGVLPVIQITAGQSTPFFLGSYSAGGFTISSGGSSAPGTYVFNYFVVQ